MEIKKRRGPDNGRKRQGFPCESQIRRFHLRTLYKSTCDSNSDSKPFQLQMQILILILPLLPLLNAWTFKGLHFRRVDDVMIPNKHTPWFVGEFEETPIVVHKYSDAVSYDLTQYQVEMFKKQMGITMPNPSRVNVIGPAHKFQKHYYWVHLPDPVRNYKPRRTYMFKIKTGNARKTIAASQPFKVFPVGPNRMVDRRLVYVKDIQTQWFYRRRSHFEFKVDLVNHLPKKYKLKFRLVNAATGKIMDKDQKVTVRKAEHKEIKVKIKSHDMKYGRYFVDVYLDRPFHLKKFIYRSKPFFYVKSYDMDDIKPTVRSYYGGEIPNQVMFVICTHMRGKSKGHKALNKVGDGFENFFDRMARLFK
jgi:hypothetical protein